jgi:hypothetical protein
MLITDVFSSIEAYNEVLSHLSQREDVNKVGLGSDNLRHSLDDLFSFEWPKEIDRDYYRPQQVEFLLDQAADLLDRGIRDRAQWADLYEKWLRNALEIRELLAISKIQDDEDRAGLFGIPHDLSSGEKAANDATSAQLQLAVSKLTTLLSAHLNKDAINRLVDDQGILAMLNVCDPLNLRHERIIRRYRDERDGTLEAKIKEFSDRVVGPNLEIEEIAYDAQLAQTQALFDAAKARVEGLQKKEQYDLKDEMFQRNRREIARRVTAAKQLASTIDGGALNFEGRMAPIQQRYENDFREAIAKIQAASVGLADLYGYREPLPTLAAPGGGLRFFDNCLIWVRDAITYLVRFQRLEQAFVASFSLKSLMREKWAVGRDAGILAFALREEQFPARWKQQYVRLRGFTAFMVGKGPTGTWPIVVYPPRTSYIVHRDGQRKNLDQNSAAPCMSGRTRSRDVLQQADVLGALEFFNLAPFGDWQMLLPSNSLEDVAATNIEDIHLDLHLVARVLP